MPASARLTAPVLVVSLLLAGAAHAQERAQDRGATASAKAAAAEQLFTEGLRLLDAGRYDEACSKLAQSERLDPSAGTLLNLADCYEKKGLFASAWVSFREAARAAADRNRPDWQRLAEKRASALERRVAHVRVDVAPVIASRGVALTIDGARVEPALVGTPIPLDPGAHTIVVSAPEHEARTFSATLATTAETRVVTVDDLPRLPPTPKETPSRSPLVPIGIVVGSVGIAGAVTSVVTGLLASSALDDAKQACPSYPVLRADCGPGARDANDDAQRFATVSTVAAIAGGVLVATGITLVLVAPSRSESVSVRAGARGFDVALAF